MNLLFIIKMVMVMTIVAFSLNSDIIQEKFANFLPMSGSEPEYKPEPWNSDSEMLKSHNCYAYFLDDLTGGRTIKPQPGHYSMGKEAIQQQNQKEKYKSCDVMSERILKDSPNIYKAQENEMCSNGYYKGYLVLDPGNDYHFYRQDSNGYFSHKRGKFPVSNVDQVGNKIINPRLAAKNYSGYNYTKSCGYFCIPSNTVAPTNSKY